MKRKVQHSPIDLNLYYLKLNIVDAISFSAGPLRVVPLAKVPFKTQVNELHIDVY